MNFKLKIFLKISSLLLLSGAFFFIYHTFNPSSGQIPFPKCPSYSLLGIVCPGCGSQRAIHHLFHFNISQAFSYNPLLVLTFPFILILIGVTLYNFIFDKKIRLKLLYYPMFTKILLVTVVVYFILRNLPFAYFQIFNPN